MMCFDFDAFEKMRRGDRPAFMWNKAHDILKVLAKETDNPYLLEAADYAWRKGLEIGLATDYRLLATTVVLHDKPFLAAIWMQSSADRMIAVFKLEKNGKVLLEKSISSTILGIRHLLWAFEGIEIVADTIVIKGSKELRELPMEIHTGIKPITNDNMEKNIELKLLRDKSYLFNQFLYKKEKMTDDFKNYLEESDRLVEEAYLAGNVRGLKAVSKDIDEEVREFPLPMALEYKKLIKEQLGIDYDVVDKMRLKAIEKLLKKGKVSNPEDYELLLGRVEEIYTDDNYKEEVERINKVLVTYHK